MATQPTALGKMTSGSSPYPVQLHLSTPISNMNRNLPVQFVNPIRIPQSVGNVHVSDRSVPLPQQPSSSNVGYPLQISSANSTNPVPGSQKTGGNIQLPRSNSNIQLTNVRNQLGMQNSIIQLQIATQNSNRQESESEKSNQGGLASKLQETLSQYPPGQLQLVPNMSGSTSMQLTPTNNTMQTRPQAKGLYYIQTPTGLKPASSTDTIVTNTSSTPSPIIVRKPATSSGLQFLPPMITKSSSTKATPANKCAQIAPKVNPQSLVIQKAGKITQNINPVSLTPTIGGKSSIPIFSLKKNTNTTNNAENQQLFVPTSHLSGQNATSQKILSMPKRINNKIILPVPINNMSAKTSAYNFQIANGQIQNDSQGNVTILGSLTNPVTEVPPLQPFSKNLPSSNVNVITTNTSTQQTNFTTDNVFVPAIPGSRVESTGEQSYAISIPETNSLCDDVYAVQTISDNNDVNNIVEKSIKFPMPEKVKSLIKTSISESLTTPDIDSVGGSTPVPAILRRSNSDNQEKKIISTRRRISLSTEKADLANNRMEHIKNQLISESISNLLDKSKSIIEHKAPSLFCDEEIDIELDNKGLKPNEATSSEIIAKIGNNPMSNMHVNKDRRKSRVSADTYHSYENNSRIVYGNNTFPKSEKNNAYIGKQRKENPALDSTGDRSSDLNWKNGIGSLNGSALQFTLNEFGLIDLLDGSENFQSGSNDHNKKKGSEYNRREKKSKSPEDLYCCDDCGCHGMAAEFVNKNFCSQSCQINYEKHNKPRKEKILAEMRKKRKQRKTILMKKNKKELNESNIVKESINTDVSVELKHVNRIDTTDEHIKNVDKNLSTLKNPWICSKSGFSWNKYLDFCRAIAAPDKYFKESSIQKNNFKKGMKLEAVDPAHPSLFAVVTVAIVQGHRLCLHFDGYEDDYDFWVNADCCDIFPAGWCEKNKRVLKPPIGFDQHTFSWSLYLRQSKAMAAPKNLFPHLSESNSCPNGFRVGMKLEAEDRTNSLTCVATVADVINNRILLHFDSWDDIYDYWVDPSSPYIHSVGWCDDNGCSLTPPNFYNNPEHFTWEEYLGKENTAAVPGRAFKPRAPHKFKIGMKLEAVDKKVPFLIRVATVSDVRDYQIRISFDGWPDELSFWVDDDCPDIHPVGWCLKTGHSLEPPLTSEESMTVGECGTNGCRGFGNSYSPRLRTHFTLQECPYRIPVCTPIHRDRLEGALPPAQHSEPRPREPRKVCQSVKKESQMPLNIADRFESNSDDYSERLPILQDRLLKRKNEDDSKSGGVMLSDDESSNQSKKKRLEHSITRDTIENSVYEPGYVPNPSKMLPPYWGGDCLLLKEILQKESFRVDPRNWNQSDVQRFVELVAKCREFSCKFSKHSIDGESFLMLSQEDLVKVIGMKLGPAIKIYNSIIQLRQKVLS